MLQVKRWAKQFLVLSPIFHSKAFRLPNNEKIMQINPRLLAPYCLNMLKQSLYDRSKITEILKKQNTSSECYWSNYVYSIIYPQSQLSNDKWIGQILQEVQQDKKVEVGKKINRLRCLISKAFHQIITRNEFSQLSTLYLGLHQAEAITQMDNYAINVSVFQLYQLLIFAEMRFQSALNAIGFQSLTLLQKFVNNAKPGNYFSIISILKRVKSKLSNFSILQILCEWLSPQADYKKILESNPNYKAFLAEQSIVFMMWLLHVNEFGQFLYQHVKQNYLLNEYTQQSLKIISRMLSEVQFDQSLSKAHLLLLAQVVSKLHQIQEQNEVFEQFQKNMQLQKLLKKLKNKIASIIQLKKLKQTNKNVLESDFLEQINGYQVNFYSFMSQKHIKTQIQQICEHPYASVLLSKAKIDCILELCSKIDNFELKKKVIQKLNIKQQTSFTSDLPNYLGSLDIKTIEIKPQMRIRNVCQLKRVNEELIKRKVQNMSSLPSLSAVQLKSLKILQLTLKDPKHSAKNTEQIEVLKSLFTSFEL